MYTHNDKNKIHNIYDKKKLKQKKLIVSILSLGVAAHPGKVLKAWVLEKKLTQRAEDYHRYYYYYYYYYYQIMLLRCYIIC